MVSIDKCSTYLIDLITVSISIRGSSVVVSAARTKSQLDFCPKGSVFESSTKTVTREKYLSHLGSDGREGISPLDFV